MWDRNSKNVKIELAVRRLKDTPSELLNYYPSGEEYEDAPDPENTFNMVEMDIKGVWTHAATLALLDDYVTTGNTSVAGAVLVIRFYRSYPCFR